MIYKFTARHPFTGELFYFAGICDDNAKKKIRLKWCKHLECFGVQAWFSKRIWIINDKITVLQ